MSMSDLIVRLDYNISVDADELFIIERRSLGGGHYVAAPLEMHKVQMGVKPLPFICNTLESSDQLISPRQFLQAMLDKAWEIGLRPKGYEDTKNELAAVRFHLEDMRKLAKVK